MAVARLANVKRADVKRLGGLALELEVRERGAVGNGCFGHRIGEVCATGEAGIALDHRRLRVPVDHDQVARVRCTPGRGGVAHKEQVNRTRDFDVPGDVHHGAVVDERRVERGEAVRVKRRDLPEVLLDEARQLVVRLGQRHDAHAVRERAASGQCNVMTAIHEHQRMPVGARKVERRELLLRHRPGGLAERGEAGVRCGRRGGEVPILVPRRGKAECLEPRDRGQAQHADGLWSRRAAVQREPLVALEKRIDHATASSMSQSYPFASSSSASSLPPERTMRPPASTCTKSGTMYSSSRW